ncbi:MAG: glycosyl transferase [Solirubrobacterales bacterium]|jgi:glycosyltransferase involved in cell wall biosynthesis/phosphoheptose isomerase|nr:glycosyl transferase [Solirubrobacterales bacterium]
MRDLQKLAIAMVSEHASPLAALGGVDAGGQNVHVAELSRAVARMGARVVVHTRRDEPQLAEWVPLARDADVHHVDAGPARPMSKDELLPYMDAFAERLHERWREERPDVVHAHFWMSGMAAMKAARPLGIPVVQTFHALGTVKRRYQGERDTSPASRLDVERDILRHADHVIATCTDEVFELIRLGAYRGRLTVIPCGVDLQLFTPEGPRAQRTPGGMRVVTVGRLVERKGIGNVITALTRLADVELIIAGGPDRSCLAQDVDARRLQALVQEEGVADRVTLCGRLERDGVARMIRSADAVVAVPWYEPFGIVPLEAMACGVPVVASAVGGMVDTVLDDVTGVHVPPRDPERLAEVLAALLADDARRAGYGRAGVDRARRLYDWGRIGAATIEVYASLASRRRGRAARQACGLDCARGGMRHLGLLRGALDRLEPEVELVEEWGEQLAGVMLAGGRLLAVGNGGSAAQAQHLTAELVGRFQTERCPLSALCLHADSSSFTAICNDYGPDEAFARQVRAHGRDGDVLLAISTSGESSNVLAAVRAAQEIGVRTWAMCGPAPSSLAALCDQALSADADSTATVQEIHMVATHLLCAAVDREVALRRHSLTHEAALA